VAFCPRTIGSASRCAWDRGLCRSDDTRSKAVQPEPSPPNGVTSGSSAAFSPSAPPDNASLSLGSHRRITRFCRQNRSLTPHTDDTENREVDRANNVTVVRRDGRGQDSRDQNLPTRLGDLRRTRVPARAPLPVPASTALRSTPT
jgi:hypothetical protein